MIMKANKHIALVCLTALLQLSIKATVYSDVVADAATTMDINGTVSYTYGAPGEITVYFPEQSPLLRPTYNAVTIVARTSSGTSAFSGNYIEAGVKSVSFKIQGLTTVSVPVALQLVLRSSVSGRVWRNSNVTASAEAGVLVVNGSSFERSAGWTRNDSGDLDALWLEDLQSVEVIGVRLAQPNREGMSYTLSDFTISGDTFIIPPAVLTPLEEALKDTFGKTSVDLLTDADKAVDSDEDGMKDYVEILSENDDVYANSIFAAEIVEISDAGIRIRWPCVVLSTYTVMRASSLMSSFEDIMTFDPVTYTGYMTYLDDTATGSGPFFYKIRREK